MAATCSDIYDLSIEKPETFWPGRLQSTWEKGVS